jgi:lipoprotein-anchoring transpeptidase ErfK/SrfK
VQHRLAKPKKGGGGFDRWLAVLVLLAVLFCLWKFSAPKKSAKKVAGPHPKIVAPLVIPPAREPHHREEQPITVLPSDVASPSTTASPVNVPAVPGFPRLPRGTIEGQIALSRAGISCGSLDGALGSQTRAAIRAFQRKLHLPETGLLDTNTRPALALNAPPYTTYVVTSNDLARLQPVGKTWLEKSQQSALDYETILELVAEKSHAHPKLVKLLNPGVDWTNMIPGTSLTVPDAAYPEPETQAAFIIINLAEKTLEAFDENTNLLAHFPCSIAKHVEKRPVGDLHVAAVAPNPNYTFDPAVFPEEPEAQQIKTRLIIPPGPNNPVGTVWISLDKPGYGMHGTPKPEDVGRTESHGCFRLANWNAEYLLKLAWVGLPVYVVQQ